MKQLVFMAVVFGMGGVVSAGLVAWTSGYNPCADFNRDGFIAANDIMELLDNWSRPPDCKKPYDGPGIP